MIEEAEEEQDMADPMPPHPDPHPLKSDWLEAAGGGGLIIIQWGTWGDYPAPLCQTWLDRSIWNQP